jgi:glycerol uptake facilitator-like aquaporin
MYSGAGFNPARDLGPRLVAIMLGFDPTKTMANYFSHYLLGTQ